MYLAYVSKLNHLLDLCPEVPMLQGQAGEGVKSFSRVCVS